MFWGWSIPDADDEALLEAFMDAVKGPDFPTAASSSAVRASRMPTHRRGSIRMRGVVDIEENKGVTTLVITELPYQVNPDNLIQSIAEQVNEEKAQGISRIEDQSSDRVGMRIVVTLRRDGVAKVVLNNLYKHSQLQTSFGANMLSIVDGVPRTLRLDQMIRFWRRPPDRRHRAADPIPVAQGRGARPHPARLGQALDALDEVIALIRRSANTTRPATVDGAARHRRDSGRRHSRDAVALELAALERQKIIDELAEIERVIADLQRHPRQAGAAAGDRPRRTRRDR